tara:strand:- start:856 stop:1134 length:279 start_codon:yes stop_codon:yes gene_type:complete
MSQNKDIISKLRDLIEVRQNTIIANKRSMKDYLMEYKKSLELDKKIKAEIRTLNIAINLLQYGIMGEDTEEITTSQNIAVNRDFNIYTNDEE